MEFLLINHPLDCPICDQGGECELQDLSMGYGRSVSAVRRAQARRRRRGHRSAGRHRDDPLHPVHALRPLHRGHRRHLRTRRHAARRKTCRSAPTIGKPLTTELSGNVIDVCPVGALTNKPFRFKARAWELIARESIGYHDALGSNLFLHTRRGEVRTAHGAARQRSGQRMLAVGSRPLHGA
jgi:NADH-quinone oxidoreductase subunit G